VKYFKIGADKVQEILGTLSLEKSDPRLYYFINSTLANYQPIIYGVANRSLIWVLSDLLSQKFKNIFSR